MINRHALRIFFLLAFTMMSVVWISSARAQTAEGAGVDLLSADELDDLVGPIALYPDDLLAITLPASTYPLEIVQASRFLAKQESNPDLKPEESWDESVIGLLNYPEIVTMMSDDLDWTQSLGNAVVNQQEDVMDAIQRFRAAAQDAGNLESSEQVVVEREKEVITIVSASPEVIYVPQYDPTVVVVQQPAPYRYVYSPPYPYYYRPAAAFWTGMFVGAAVGYGIGWHSNDININRNVNINRNTNITRNDINRGGNGGKWKPDRRPGGGSVGRPNTRPGSRYGDHKRRDNVGGDRPGNNRVANNRAGNQRPKASTRPNARGGNDMKRPSNRQSQASRNNVNRTKAKPNRSVQHPTSKRSSVSGYKSNRKTAKNSNRGHRSRASASSHRNRSGGGGRRGGGGRGGRG